MALAPLSQTIFLTEDGSAVSSPKAVTIPPLLTGPAPAPSIQTPAMISGDPQVGETLTGVDPVFRYATINRRTWLKNGTALAMTQTYVPAEAGEFVWSVEGTGDDGSPITSEAAVTVAEATPSTPATFTIPAVVQKPAYQRTSKTGGSQGKGSAPIRVPVNVTGAGAIWYRTRSAAGEVIQAPRVIAMDGTGSQVVTATVDVRLAYQILELSGSSSGPWTTATVPFLIGTGIVAIGQSLMVRLFVGMDNRSDTIDSLQIPVSDFGLLNVDWDTDPANAFGWAKPKSSWPGYTGAGAAELLRLRIAATGVPTFLVGYARGGQGSWHFAPGGEGNAALRKQIALLGGFEEVLYLQGHSDAQYLSSSSVPNFKANLTAIFADLAAQNTIFGADFAKYMMTIPNVASDFFGVRESVVAIRTAAAEWAAANGAVYIQPGDIELYDTIHQTQVGSRTLGRYYYRAMRPALGLPHSHVGPRIASGTRVAGSAEITLTLAMPADATTIAGKGDIASRFAVFPSGTRANPLALASSAAVTLGTNTITLRLASVPANSVAVDVYFCLPIDPDNVAMIYDNVTDGDGIADGRALMTTMTPVQIAAPNAAPAVQNFFASVSATSVPEGGSSGAQNFFASTSSTTVSEG